MEEYIRARKVEWKSQVTKRQSYDEEGERVDVARMDDFQDCPRGDPIVTIARESEASVDPIERGATYEGALECVVAEWSLNREQKRAFDIVAKHTLADRSAQLLMYLGGPGGTGKSRVVSALKHFFGLRDQVRRFLLAAYTGVAARNIGGATLHALLQLNEGGQRYSVKRKRDLEAM